MAVQFTHNGLAEILSARHKGFKTAITHIAAGDQSYTPEPAQLTLRNEKQRVAIMEYEQLTPTQLRMAAKFAGEDEYEVREIGFFLESGTLLAVYSLPDTLLTYKSKNSAWVQKFTLDISPLPSDSITVNVGSENLNILLANELAVLSSAQIDQMTRQLELKERVEHLAAYTTNSQPSLMPQAELRQLIQSIINSNDLMKQLIPVGVPLPWPSAIPPMGFFKCDGSSFDKNTYPLLAQAYPSGVLPDLRGEFIRGWDDGRGVDKNRNITSLQLDGFAHHVHAGLNNSPHGNGFAYTLGYSSTATKPPEGGHGAFPFNDNLRPAKHDGTYTNGIRTHLTLDAANETRPRNIAFLYIVRAA